MKIEINLQAYTSGLYLVATPIGNLGDITLRALDLLSQADIIYCEDTRQTQKLLNAYSIKTKTASYHDHSSDQVRSKIIKSIFDDQKIVALVSDAGMPLISDPGYKLVQEAYKNDINVTTLPGANAVLSAVQLSGLPSEPFMFLGFLPTKQVALEKELLRWKEQDATLVFYEAKQRVLKTVSKIQEVYGNRQIAVIRELTKKFEEVLRGTTEDVLQQLNAKDDLKGEFVILVAPAEAENYSEDKIASAISDRLDHNMPVKQIAEELAELSGWSKKDIYNLALKLKSE